MGHKAEHIQMNFHCSIFNEKYFVEWKCSGRDENKQKTFIQIAIYQIHYLVLSEREGKWNKNDKYYAKSFSWCFKKR